MLPFDRVAEIRQQGGPVVASDVPVAIWPAGAQETSVGEAYDYTGEASAIAAEHLVRKTNRELISEGRRYKVIEAHEMDYVPHVALRLREMR